jgi:hypothetical protein
MNMHPYISFKIVPNPSSGVSKTVADSDLKSALERNLTLISERNGALTPRDVYDLAMARRPH